MTRRSDIWMLTVALGRTAGRDALRAALPVYLALFVVWQVLLNEEAIEVLSSPRYGSVRAVMWMVWLVFTLPAARALLASPSTFWLRSLPIRHATLLRVQAGFLVLAELPWGYIWGRGSGLLAGGAVVLIAATAHAVMIAPGLSIPRIVAGVVAVAAIVAPLPTRARWGSHDTAWLASLAIDGSSLAVLPLVLGDTWARAPERGRRTHYVWVRRSSRLLTLATAVGAIIVRGHTAILVRGASLAVASATCAYAAFRAGEATTVGAQTALANAFGVPAIVLASFGVAGPLLRAERGMAWLLDANAVPARQRHVATAMAAALFGAVLAGMHISIALLAARVDSASGLAIALESIVTGASSAAITVHASRWCIRDEARDAKRVLAVAALFVLVAAFSAMALEQAMPIVWLSVALVTVCFFPRALRSRNHRPLLASSSEPCSK
ncbi:hypothetical protein LVJ94_50700 [Pendulispora rubella]|uniref:Uncharacterized protein n=1 Tax=Pendulispora rubella TaxID=2741070 RepID=A0ABZ2L2H5_9BACT